MNWYHSHGRAVAGEVPERIAMVKATLVRHCAGAIVRVMSPTDGGARATSEHVQTPDPAFGGCLPD